MMNALSGIRFTRCDTHLSSALSRLLPSSMNAFFLSQLCPWVNYYWIQFNSVKSVRVSNQSEFLLSCNYLYIAYEMCLRINSILFNSPRVFPSRNNYLALAYIQKSRLRCCGPVSAIQTKVFSFIKWKYMFERNKLRELNKYLKSTLKSAVHIFPFNCCWINSLFFSVI